MVRSFASRFYRPPWPFIKKGSMGQRKIGPMHFEEHKWPGQNREFPELSPKFQKNNMPELRGYTGVQLMGYTDPVSGKFVRVKEMIPELIVPDLTGFELKPYVSYRTDVEIEKRYNKYTELVTKKGSEAAADLLTVEAERWPPPKMTAQTLFDLFYAEKVQDSFIALKSQKGDSATSKSSTDSNKGLLNGLAMRNPFKIAKRSLHTTSLCFRGPLKFPGWYPRDHKPGPFPNTEKERRASAIKYGLRPEDYKTISKDNVQNYCGDYPDLGVVTFDHKDPYEDYSNRMFRRNWGEPVAKDSIYYRPDRLTFTGLEIQDYTWKRAVYLFFQVCTPMFLLFWYLRNATSDSFRWKNPVMPKQYPYDFNRAWPLEDPRNYPIENYSFELTEPIEHVDAVQNEQAAEKMTTANDELVQETKQEAELIDKTESTTPIESEKIV